MEKKESKQLNELDLEQITTDLESINFETNTPYELKTDYKWMLIYTYPGPLSCLSGIQRGCSGVVNSGTNMGFGKFCDYVVLCAGTTVTIMYNEFRRIA